ncbi:MAG TPA: D-alanine--D-alanine ligase [Candidatus Marinimicrobia bacterium]|jgi:D-alanine-D-alanine ligase|nr:D-alanine--D-alanine ligase [Candidatus Neomarinimicrobiota bacterium]
MKIGVLLGGNSAEREVSLASGKAISAACKELGHNVLDLDPEFDVRLLVSDLLTVDLVFNGLHGGDGENGVIPGFLQSLGVKYTGSKTEASAICMDKRISKALVHRKDLLTPNWVSLANNDPLPSVGDMVFPVVIKPNDQGSTIGLTVVKDESELDDAIELARQFANVVLIEEFIVGKEITVTVIGDKAYPIVEIVPSHGLYDYECKYNQGMTEYFCPANIDKDLTKAIQESALKIHKLLGCRHYSRADFRLDENGKAWFLELNTLPGMTETSLVPKAAKASGLSFPELIQTIINEALKN